MNTHPPTGGIMTTTTATTPQARAAHTAAVVEALTQAYDTHVSNNTEDVPQ